MANTKHEDAILKMGFDYFRDTILKILGIHHDFVESGITELVELTIHSLYMDFTFLTKDDFYIHIEFQTTDSGKKDLRRFHAYESVLSHKTGKNVITYVIYSGGIEHAVTEMKCGTCRFRYLSRSTNSYCRLPMPMASACSSVWMPWRDSMRSIR